MTTNPSLGKTALSLILVSMFSIMLTLTLTYVKAEDNYKNNTNPLTGIYESTLAENGYKANIIINPDITGTQATENNYKLDLAINPNPIGSQSIENGFKIDLTPQKSFPEPHDITVASMTNSKTIVGKGYTINITITLTNKEFTHETFPLTIYANTTAINTQTITLTSKSTKTITYAWNTAGVAYGNYTISAYAAPTPGEAFTADNTYTSGKVLVTIPGDVNGDKTVDVFDILKIKYHRSGPPPGPGGYDINVDINGDEFIDVFDILIAKAHLGESW